MYICKGCLYLLNVLTNGAQLYYTVEIKFVNPYMNLDIFMN